jgi:sorbose reductase
VERFSTYPREFKDVYRRNKLEVQEADLPLLELRAYECDTSSKEDVKDTFRQIVEDLGKVDVGCTNAGITGGEPAEKYGLKDWRKMLDVNVHGTFLVAREAGQAYVGERYKRFNYHGLVDARPRLQPP